MRFRPERCPHGRTRILYDGPDRKVEECLQCDTIIREFDVSADYYCEAPTANGECSRKVSSPTETCWQHD